MKSNLQRLQKKYNLDIEAPFILDVEGELHTFQCLIKGYGANNGMVVDKDWSKIEIVAAKLVALGYGYSCFDIEEGSPGEGFQEVLEDWGKTSA